MEATDYDISKLASTAFRFGSDELFKPFPTLTKEKKENITDLTQSVTTTLQSNGEMTFEQLCNKKPFADLLHKLQTNVDFPRNDPAYQALTWHFRKLPKTDTHCHLGMGLSLNQLASIICELGDSSFNKVLENLSKSSIQGLRKKLTDLILLFPTMLVKSKPSIKFLIRLSGVLRNWETASFFILSKQTLYLAVEGVASNYLKDNVTKFSIRLNPFKTNLYPKDTDIFAVFHETIETIISALDDSAEKHGVEKQNLTVTISLNRIHDARNMEYCNTLLSNWNKLGTEIKSRITGLDLSGPEGVLSDLSIHNWLPVIEKFSKELQFTPHLGDIRNLKKKSSLYDKWVTYLKGGQTTFLLLDFIQEHFNFIQEYLEVMPSNSSIAHGISVTSKIPLLKPKDPNHPNGKRSLFVFDLEQPLVDDKAEKKRKAVLSQLQLLKELLRSKNIKVCFCPTATVKSLAVDDFSRLPIYEWVAKDSINVKIGIDGVYQYPHPKTLSEELTKLFISKPKFSRPLTYNEVIKLIS